MKLDGIHHITGITADAQANVDFYAGVLGLRLVKKSVNQDQTSVYHLFYADELGEPGSDITFFEYPGLPKGRAGAGMVHRVVWRVGSPEALEFWHKRLADHGYESQRDGDELTFEDPEGLTHVLAPSDTADEPLIANHPEIPAELALQGFEAVRAYTNDPERSQALLTETLGFDPTGPTPPPRSAASAAAAATSTTRRPSARPLQGAGTVHHVAWAAQPGTEEEWQQRVSRAGAHATPVIDRHYFRSVYFREPSGVLFEIATIGPGFAVDEPLEQLGEKLSLTPQYEHLRAEIEPTLTPLRNPRDTLGQELRGCYRVAPFRTAQVANQRLQAPQFGLFLIPDAEDAAITVARAVEAERLGLDLIGIQDHPYQRRFLDTFSLLAFIAARTERIRLTPDVANLPLRPRRCWPRRPRHRRPVGRPLRARARGGRVLGCDRTRWADRGAAAKESVDALEEAIEIIRLSWSGDARSIRRRPLPRQGLQARANARARHRHLARRLRPPDGEARSAPGRRLAAERPAAAARGDPRAPTGDR